jgi:hypothetical protein
MSVGRKSTSAKIISAASVACCRVSATTTAIGSPTWRTLSLASNVRAAAGLNGEGIGSSPSDSAVCTASTPGIPTAPSMSIDRIVPWATADRA